MGANVKIICRAVQNALFKAFESDFTKDGHLVITPDLRSGQEVLSHLLKSGKFKDSFMQNGFTTVKKLCSDLVGKLCSDKVVICPTSAKEILKDIVQSFGNKGIFVPIKDHAGLYDNLYRLIIKLKENGYGKDEKKPYNNDIYGSFIDIYHFYNSYLNEHGLFDEADEILFAKENIAKSGLVEGKELFVIGFVRFLKYEEEIIGELIRKCGRANIYLYYDNSEKAYELYKHISGFIGRIREGYNADVSFMEYERKDEGTNLSYIKENLFTDYIEKPDFYSDDRSLEVISANGIKDEVQVLALKIRELLSNGYRPDDIAVIVRDEKDYLNEIDKAFKSYGVPSCLKMQELILHLNVIKTAMRPLYLVSRDFLRDDVTSFLGSGYIKTGSGIDLGRAELILKSAGIMKGSKSYDIKLKNLSSVATIDDKTEINGTREFLMDFIDLIKRRIKREDTVLNYRKALTSLLENDLCIRERMVSAHERIAPGLMKRDIYAYSEFLRAFDELVNSYRLSGKIKNKIPVNTLIDLLIRQLEGRTIKTGKNISLSFKDFKDDAVVSVFSPEDFFIKDYKAVFVLNMTFDTFPKKVIPSFLLGDYEDRFSYVINKEELLESERLLFLRIVSLCSERLFISYVKAGGDELALSSGGKSPFIDDLTILIEGTHKGRSIESESEKAISSLFSFRCADDVMDSFFLELIGKTTDEKKEVFDHLLSSTEKDSYKRILENVKIEFERYDLDVYTSYEGNLKEQKEELKERLVEKIDERTFSASQIDMFANCPIGYFFSKILYLDSVEEPEPDISSKDKGTILHNILFRYHSSKERPTIAKISSLSADELQEYILMEQSRIEKIADDYFSSMSEAHTSMDTHILRIEKKNIINILKNVVKYELDKKHKAHEMLMKRERQYEEALIRSERSRVKGKSPKYLSGIKEKLKKAKEDTYLFQPKYFEHGFGSNSKKALVNNFGGEHSPSDSMEVRLDLGGGEEIKIRGYIDRIDVNEAEGLFAVIDYKSGKHPGSGDVQKGRSFQLPIYTEYVEKSLLKGGKSACGIYFSLSEPKRTEIKVPFGEVKDRLLECIMTMRAGCFFARPDDCKSYCDFKSICRLEMSGND